MIAPNRHERNTDLFEASAPPSPVGKPGLGAALLGTPRMKRCLRALLEVAERAAGAEGEAVGDAAKGVAYERRP
jgi:hypothetical protein